MVIMGIFGCNVMVLVFVRILVCNLFGLYIVFDFVVVIVKSSDIRSLSNGIFELIRDVMVIWNIYG